MSRFDFVICNRVSRGESYVKGARRDVCADCHEHVWVSPSALLVSLSTPVICIDCMVMRQSAVAGPIEIAPITDAQLAEMRGSGIDVPRGELEHAALDYFEKAVAKHRNRS